MKSLIYWTLATLLLALVVHLFVVIFVPGVDTGQKMAEIEAAGSINTLHLIDGGAPGASLLSEPNPDLAYAYCKFDITAQPLLISARVPTSYWSVSVYSETAENVYTLNDTQAGVRTVRLLLVDEDEQARFLGSDDGGERPLNAIVVGTPEKTGLVLFRAFVSDHSRRDIVRADLEASNCRPFTLPATSGGGDGQRLSASPG